MILRKLRKEEHGRTRPLWERIFPEDGARFLDYYYTEKTAENEIYVIEADGEIRSMLQLNPYLLRVGEKELWSRYIVAVATEEDYRRRGYMAALLQKSLRDMYSQGLPFAFLMPASEKIYHPYAFRFIYAADRWEAARADGSKPDAQDLFSGEWRPSGRTSEGNKRVNLRVAGPDDAKRLAQFASRILRGSCQVYVKRDWQYYERMLWEQEILDGGILLAESEGQILGALLFDGENGFSVREPLTVEGQEQIFADAGLPLSRGERKQPMIMARLLCVENLLACMTCREETELSFLLEDPLFRENHKLFQLRGSEERVMVRTKPYVKGMEDQTPRISVTALTSILFGYRSPEQAEEEEKEVLSPELKEGLRKLRPLSPVFLNELV